MSQGTSGLLRLIAVFKFFKAATLIAVGVGALKLVHHDRENFFEHAVRIFGLNPGGRYVDRALGKLLSVSPKQMKELGVGSFVYAGLFLTEGTGLWLQRRWGEWVTVIITSSLVPLEVWEIHRHPSVGKGLVTAINVAVVVYLVVRIRRGGGKQ